MKNSFRPLLTALCLQFLAAPLAHAFEVNIGGAFVASVYFRVGDGVYTGTFINGGTPRSGGPVSMVSVAVPASQVGNGTDQLMSSNASIASSFYDGYAFCNLPNEVYIGGYNRSGWFSGGDGTVTVTSPPSLTNGTSTIPFSQISWTTSGNGDNGVQPFPAGTFNGGTLSLGNFPVNRWRESCYKFSYGNDNLVASGTYTGQVTYTLSVP